MSEDKGIETLKVWQKAMALTLFVHQMVLPTLPLDEKWSLSTQLRRSVQSIPANVAEGYGRYYYQEGIRFSYMARGSLEEAYTQISIAYKLGYIPKDTFDKLISDIQELRRLLNGYISFLKRSKRGDDTPGSTQRIQEDPIPYIPDAAPENGESFHNDA